ncbi:MAG: endo alpha-1,4 polygalactosaminidase [bacterium]
MTTILMRVLIATLTLFLLLTGCGGESSVDGGGDDTIADQIPPPITDGNWYRPEPLVTWQWQLNGVVNISYNVEIYDIDLFDSSEMLIQQLQASGKKVVCYFSAGSYEAWRSDAGRFKPEDLGNTLDGFPAERWLDIRSLNVQAIMKDRLDLAQQKGCDGVEPDNMDGYINDSGFSLTAAEQLAFNRLIANEAHKRNLSVGLKNDLDQINELVNYFDFAVNEQCFEFSECEALSPFINESRPVLNAEYKQEYVNNSAARAAMCNQSRMLQFSTLILPVELDDSFRFSCL